MYKVQLRQIRPYLMLDKLLNRGGGVTDGDCHHAAEGQAQDCKSAELKERCPEPGTAHLATEKNPVTAAAGKTPPIS
jgi:hypothetical protein